ncbi:MAG TPA: cytochrome b/b6 domain-containing protein [Phycisphaerae bacterium]|nr:cytochrome b/b6 domain-containing protein [Phycisphaerae bacterium]
MMPANMLRRGGSRAGGRTALSHFRAARLFAVALVLAITSAARGDDPDNCLLCHQYRGLSRLDESTGRAHLFFVDPQYSISHRGPHARLACTACHEREEVSVVPHKPVTRVDCARQCHLGSPTGIERRFSHDNIPPVLTNSAHSLDLLKKLTFSQGPLLEPEQSACLYCHDEPLFRDPAAAIPRFRDFAGRVFERCDTCHADKIAADIEYYVQHIASRFQPARSTMELSQVCAVCHSDPAVLAEFKLHNSVASYVRSFHGKAALLGDPSTADCLSCHVRAGQNAHQMLAPDHPDSAVNAAHIANSCRSTLCHPGSDPKIAETAVHLDLPTAQGTLEYALALTFVVLTVLTFGPSCLLVLLDLFQVVVGRAVHGEARLHYLARRVLLDPRGKQRLTRLSVSQRVQHWVLTLLFVTLVLTGFPMKFADQAWAGIVVRFFGGLGVARVIHHWSGIALVVGFMAHLFVALASFVRSAKEFGGPNGGADYKRAWLSLPMWISPDDVRKTFQLLGYMLFLRKDRPNFGRFSPAEKFEYLGVFWGTMLLGITGLLLWGEQISSHFLSGRAFNLATIAHTYEAFLAVIHVGILHIYNVIFAPKVFPLSTATLDGRTPMAKLVEEHGELIEDAARDLGIPDESEDSHE